MKCTLWNWSEKCHLWRRKREQPAPVDVDVSVSVQRYSVQCKGYNLIGVTTVEGGTTRGTTHWFIDSYIAAYIQGQYRILRVHPTGLTIARGVRRCPHSFLLFQELKNGVKSRRGLALRYRDNAMIQFALSHNTLVEKWGKVIASSSLEPLSHPKVTALSKFEPLSLLKVIVLRTHER